MFKRIISGMICATICAATITGCGTGAVLSSNSETSLDDGSQQSQAQEQTKEAIKASPDKYTWYVKDYVGMNAASIGYTSLNGDRRDAYGAGNIKIVYLTSDGSYVDVNDDEDLKKYVVTGQNLEPNTEIKYTFQLDQDGNEYDNLVDTQNYDEIVLSVSPVKSNDPAPKLTIIQASPDKYTRYVKDYVGRNLAACGYYSLGQTYNDSYGSGYIQLDIVADDGSYVDASDSSELCQYVVTAQSVEPNTPITFSFMTDGNGKEYSNLVQTQSIESISLTVRKLEQQASD